jgi:hypothetical protein
MPVGAISKPAAGLVRNRVVPGNVLVPGSGVAERVRILGLE